MTQELHGPRIKALCELLGMSRVRLAEGIGATPSQLSKIESGQQRFPLELAASMAALHSIPLEFFSQADPGHENAVPTFRKKARTTALEQKRITRLAREAARVFTATSAQADYRTFEPTTEPDTLDDIEQMAREIRRAARIDDGDPVPNVTRALERQGIAVINGLDPNAERVQDLSGISLPTRHDRRPLVAIAAQLPGAVARFTLAHEAAHHIWDHDLPSPITSSRDHRELRAHRFAGAFLLPSEAVRQRISEGTTLRGYLPLKADYGLSVGAIILRAKTLGVVSEQRAKSLHIQLSSLGWRDPDLEPVDVPAERPLLLKQALARVTSLDAISLIRYTGLPASLVHHWLQLQPASPAAATQSSVVDLASERQRREQRKSAAGCPDERKEPGRDR